MKKSELEKKTVAELRALARDRGLRGYSAMRKEALIEELAGPSRGAAGAAPSKKAPKATRKSRTATAVAPGRKAAPAKMTTKSVAPQKAPATTTTKKVAPRKAPARKAAPSKTSKMAAGKPAGRATARRKPASSGAEAAVHAPDVESVTGRGLSPRTRRAFSVYRAIGEQRVQASKYYLGVQEAPDIDDGFMFPATHGENIVVLMVRDPYWLFSYWEFAPNLNEDLIKRVGEEALRRSRLVLRVYDVTGTDVGDPVSYHDIDVAFGARDWYINVTHVESEYCVDIGIILPDGTFVVIARSNRVSLPPIGPTEEVDEEWVSIESLGEVYRHTERGPTSGSGGWGSGGWGRG